MDHYTNIEDQDSFLRQIKLYFMGKMINDITVKNLQDFFYETKTNRKDGKKGELSASRMKGYYSVMSSIFKIATRWGYIERNPIKKIIYH